MRIGVFSDSHGDISNARRFFDRLAPLDCLFHLGDYASDGEKLSQLFGAEARELKRVVAHIDEVLVEAAF